MIVGLPKAKEYLRIDTDAEDDIVRKLLRVAESLCIDVARMDEEADHKALTLTLRTLLMGVRKEVF